MRSILALLFLSIALTSCCQVRCRYPVVGADEFVIDSYKIRQGKLAILELEGFEIEELTDGDLNEYVDYICDGDVFNIAVYHPVRHDLMEAIRFINVEVGFKVRDGMICIPDLSPIIVVGMTLEQARDAIQDAFREQVKDIDVFISYKERSLRKVELTGDVAVPTVFVDGRIRLYEVLALAKVPNTANFFKSYVIRGCKQLAVDLQKLMQDGDMCQNIVMRGGDKIFIANANDARVMVMGEVGIPMPISVPKGFISLREALVAARGIPYTGNRNCIQIIRGNMIEPKVYMVSWDHVVNLPNDSLLLMPGDTVYVSETPLTRWHRTWEQILPLSTQVMAGYAIYDKVGG
jgi:polysaccharide export outer membrane protein